MILNQECTRNRLSLGLCPDPLGNTQRSPNLLARLRRVIGEVCRGKENRGGRQRLEGIGGKEGEEQKEMEEIGEEREAQKRSERTPAQ